MKVRMLKLAAGPAGTWNVGHEVEVSDALGLALVACKSAVALDAPALAPESAPLVETATEEPEEIRPAVARKGRGGRR